MKAIITKQEVSVALSALIEAGKKTSLPALHAALGGRGSLSTIQKFKKEIEADQEEQGSQMSEGALAMFRQVWTQAQEEGKASKDMECAELRETLDAVNAESERSVGELIAAQSRLSEVEAQRDSLVAELAKAAGELTAARTAAEQTGTKLGQALERLNALQDRHTDELTSLRKSHDAETGALRTQLANVGLRAHETALTLAGSDAKLNSLNERLAEEERRRERLLSDLAKATEQADAARATADQAMGKLAASLERHAVEVAELQGKLTMCEKKGHELELELARSHGKLPKSASTPKSKN